MSAGTVVDRWTTEGPDGKRVRTERWGSGKRWQARWRDPLTGQQRSRAADSKAAGQTILATVHVEAMSGTYVTAEAGSLTVAAYAEQWLARQVHYRPATARKVEQRIRLHVVPTIGALRLRDVTAVHVQDWVAKLTRVPLAPSTVHVAHAHLATMFADAVRERRVTSNPAQGVRLPRKAAPQVTPLTPAQLAALVAAMAPNLRAAVLLGAGTGMRQGELMGLTWDRVSGDTVLVDRQLSNTGGSSLTPVWSAPKTDRGRRRVRLAPVTMEALEAHRQAYAPGPGGLVFSARRGQVVTHREASRDWRRAVELAGLSDQVRDRSGWHDLRHFHASLLLAEGRSVRYVADRLGHDPAVLLQVYAHVLPTEDDRALDVISTALAGV